MRPVCHAPRDPHYTAPVDPRFERIFKDQQSGRFQGLSGSEFSGTIRVADSLLNQCVAAALPPDGMVRAVTVRSHAGNRLEAKVALARPAFLPALTVQLEIDTQPALPDNPVLVLRLGGGAGSLLKLTQSLVRRAVSLPPGMSIDGDRVFVDIRALLLERGHAEMLDFAQQMHITTEEAGLAVVLQVRVP